MAVSKEMTYGEFTEFTCFLMRSAMKKIDRYLSFQLEEYV